MTKSLSAVLKWCVSFGGVGAALVGTLAFGGGHALGHRALFIVVLGASMIAFVYVSASGLYQAILWLLQRPRPIRKSQQQPVRTRPSTPNEPIKGRLLGRSSDMDLRETVNFALGVTLFTAVTEVAAFLCVLVGVGGLAFYPGLLGVAGFGFSILFVICSVPDAAREAFRLKIIGEAAIVLLVIAMDTSMIAIPAILA